MIKRIFLWLLVVVFLIAGGIVAFIYFNEDLLKNKLVQAINERLIVPAKVKDIQISPLSTFPDASVTFYDVSISDPHKPDALFAKASEIVFSFNIWELITGELVLEQIGLKEGVINIIQYTDEKWSYQIYKEIESKKDEEHFTLDIQQLEVDNVFAHYISDQSNISWSGNIASAEASIKVQGPVTWINLKSKINSDIFKYKDAETLQNREVDYNGEIVVDKHWRITTTLLEIGDSRFDLTVNKNDESIIAKLTSQNADIKALLSLMPEQVHKRLTNYKSSGNISFESQLNYKFEDKTSLSSDLVFNNVDLIQNEPAIAIKNLNLSGKVKIPDFNSLSTASFQLSNIRVELNGEAIEGEFSMRNFENPFLDAAFKGQLPLTFIKDITKLEISNPSGDLHINVAFQGNYSAMKEASTLQMIKSSGEINLSKIKFNLPDRSYAVEIPAGNILFTNDHMAINELHLIMGSSQFDINGQVKKFYNINTKRDWSAAGDIHSKSLMLDELLSVENRDPSTRIYTFMIPDNINLDINASVDFLKVRKFTARQATGKLTVRDKRLRADKFSLNSMGGLVKLQGEWKDLNSRGSNINLSFLLSGINADSLFYNFENFNQDFITDKNLSGKLYAEAVTSIDLDSNLIVLPNSLQSTLKVRILKGVLKDFEPLDGLERYLDNADLSVVQFSELDNQIIVQNSVVTIPMMVVGTNIIKLKIGGSHSFDQHIDYDVVAPLIRKKKKDSDEQYGRIEEDQHGESLVFLSIKGTTKDYEITIDKQAVKDEIASDVKREIKELQDAFKYNGKTTKTEVELSEEEYFDWDNQEN